jgi:hypothetical protein
MNEQRDSLDADMDKFTAKTLEVGAQIGGYIGNTVGGAVFDLIFGQNYGGYGQSAEQYAQADQGQQTDIYINADNLSLNAQSVNVNQAQALPEVSAPDDAAFYQNRDAEEAAFWAMKNEAAQNQTHEMEMHP